jgi:hypothetical protein
MRTTQRYYLLVQPEDLLRASAVQEALVGSVPRQHLTEPDRSRSRRRRAFPGPQGRRRALPLPVTGDQQPQPPRGSRCG